MSFLTHAMPRVAAGRRLDFDVKLTAVLERRLVFFFGTVQGVYFRDTVQRIATHYAVAGFVRNVGYDRVELQAEAEPSVLDAFLADVHAHPPPAAVVQNVETSIVPATGERGFAVVRSTGR
jgi:hydrogenase maturation factor HypF (carbamoyltransferase family)